MIQPIASSVEWAAVFTTVIITVPPTINALVNFKIARGQAVEQHKIFVITEKVHTLVNSQYGIALALIVEKAARIYEISRSAADKADLDNAKMKLAEHEAKQKVVDDGEVQ